MKGKVVKYWVSSCILFVASFDFSCKVLFSHKAFLYTTKLLFYKIHTPVFNTRKSGIHTHPPKIRPPLTMKKLTPLSYHNTTDWLYS